MAISLVLSLVLIINLVPSFAMTVIAETLSAFGHEPVIEGTEYAGDYTPEAVPLPYLKAAYEENTVDEIEELLLPLQDEQSAENWARIFRRSGRKKTYPDFADLSGIDVDAYFEELTGREEASPSEAKKENKREPEKTKKAKEESEQEMTKATASEAAPVEIVPEEVPLGTLPEAASSSNSRPINAGTMNTGPISSGNGGITPHTYHSDSGSDKPESASSADAPEIEPEFTALDISIKPGDTLDPYYGIYGNMRGYYVGLNLTQENECLDRYTPGDYTLDYIIIDKHNQVIEEISRVVSVEETESVVTFQMEPEILSVTPDWLLKTFDREEGNEAAIEERLTEGVTALDRDDNVLPVRVTDTKKLENLLTPASPEEVEALLSLAKAGEEEPESDETGEAGIDSRNAYEAYVAEHSLASIDGQWYKVAYGTYPYTLEAVYDQDGSQAAQTTKRSVCVQQSVLRAITTQTEINLDEVNGNDSTGDPAFKTFAKAIAAVPSGGTIRVFGTINVTGALVHLKKKITIIGDGTDATLVNGTVAGAGGGGFLEVHSGSQLNMENITMDCGGGTRAIMVWGASGSPAYLNLTNVNVKNGSAKESEGGGLYLSNGIATVNNCTFSKMHSGRNGGGAIYLTTASTMTIHNTSITDCSVLGGKPGGGIWIDSGGVLMIDDQSVVKNNLSGTVVSNIYNSGTLKVLQSDTPNGFLGISTSAPKEGKVVINDSDRPLSEPLLHRITYDDVTYKVVRDPKNDKAAILAKNTDINLDEVNGNDETGIPAFKTLAKALEKVPEGGTVHVFGTVHMDSSTTIRNKVHLKGVGDNAVVQSVCKDTSKTLFNIYAGGELTIEQMTLDLNKLGRAFHVSGDVTIKSVLTCMNLVIKNGNTSLHGGAIYASNGKIYLDHTTIQDCMAANGHGGAVSVMSHSEMRISESTITGNSVPAVKHGGGINVGPDATVTVDDKSTIKDNTAGTVASNIYTVGTVILEQTGAPAADIGFTVDKPAAGKIVINDSKQEISNELLHMLHSDDPAYKIIQDPKNLKAAMLINGDEIYVNEASGDDATGFPAYKTIEKAMEVVPDGGTIHVFGTVHMPTSVMVRKKVHIKGFADDTVLINTPKTAISMFNLSAGDGGISLEDCTIDLNKKGRLLFLSGSESVGGRHQASITNVTVKNGNMGAGWGAIAYVSNSDLYVNNSILQDSCIVRGNGGAIAMRNKGTVTISNSIITGNTAPEGKKGGGIYLEPGCTLNIDDISTVRNNHVGTKPSNIDTAGTVILEQTGTPSADIGFTVDTPTAGKIVVDSSAAIGAQLMGMLHSDMSEYRIVLNPNNPKQVIVSDEMDATYIYELPSDVTGAPKDCRPGVFGNQSGSLHIVPVTKKDFTPHFMADALLREMPKDLKKALDGWYLNDWYQVTGKNASIFTDFNTFAGDGYEIYAAWNKLAGASVECRVETQAEVEAPQNPNYKTKGVSKDLHFDFMLPQVQKTGDTVAVTSAYVDTNPTSDVSWLYGKADGGTYDLGSNFGTAMPAGAMPVDIKDLSGSTTIPDTLPELSYYLHTMVVYTRADGQSPVTQYPVDTTTKLDLKSASLAGIPTPEYQVSTTSWQLSLTDDNVKQVAWSPYNINDTDVPAGFKEAVLNTKGFDTASDSMLWLAEDFGVAQKDPTVDVTLTPAQIQSLEAGTFYAYVKDSVGNTSMLSVNATGKILNLKVTSKLNLDMLIGDDSNNIVGENQVDIVNHSVFPITVEAVKTETIGDMTLVKDNEIAAGNTNISLQINPIAREDGQLPFAGAYELADINTTPISLGTLAKETGSAVNHQNASSFYITGHCNEAMPADSLSQVKIQYVITPVVP